MSLIKPILIPHSCLDFCLLSKWGTKTVVAENTFLNFSLLQDHGCLNAHRDRGAPWSLKQWRHCGMGWPKRYLHVFFFHSEGFCRSGSNSSVFPQFSAEKKPWGPVGEGWNRTKSHPQWGAHSGVWCSIRSFGCHQALVSVLDWPSCFVGLKSPLLSDSIQESFPLRISWHLLNFETPLWNPIPKIGDS